MTLRLGLGLSQPVVSAAAAAPPELFPDPTLSHVTDSTNGWSFDNASPGVLEPTGGTGPGITLTAADDGQFCNLVGADAAAFLASVAIGASVTVALTIANYASGACIIIVRGDQTSFTPSGNGVVSHTLTAGASTDESSAFGILGGTSPGTFRLAHISVT
jgi:hypothetical protein